MEIGDLATWVMGIATIALFVVAFIQINNERMARIKGEKELEARKKRSQAELISSWIVNEFQDKVWVAILNQSPQPVYQVVVSIVVVAQTGERRIGDIPYQTCISVAPPGQGYTAIEASYHGMARRPGVEIAFKDTAGRNWVRKADGELLEIEKSTIQYYQIKLPRGWGVLMTELPKTDTAHQG